jgi:hypothetical protein
MHVTVLEFLDCLFADGRVRVPGLAEISDKELRAADRALSAFEQEYRRELPGRPPPLWPPAARWAATMLFRACQFVAFRDAGEATLARTMSVACPAGDPASVHYSVDLTFRYLPDLYGLARRASQRDPLLTHISCWAVDWPLSSVGMADIGPVRIDPWVKDSCLLNLYIDRVIARGDVSRLNDPRVREALQQSVGLFPELAPKIVAAASDGAIRPKLALEDMP